MKRSKKVLIGVLIVLFMIQFIRPKRNVSAQTSSNDITLVHPIPGDVKGILAKACNDCHSNNTMYPWYAEVQPVGWWLANHVNDGKKALNFSEFASYRPRKQYRKMEEAAELVENGEMPLHSYTSIHKDAKLNDAERKAFIGWANAVRDSLKKHYPIDSLQRKK